MLRTHLSRYGLAVASVVLATIARRLLDPWIGERFAFLTLSFAVVAVAGYAGRGPALLATLLGAAAAAVYLFPPDGVPAVLEPENRVGVALFVVVGSGIALLGGGLRSARLRVEAQAREVVRQRERLRVTLASIGDAVITTDEAGRVEGLNLVAEAITGWPQAEAAGRPLEEVFRIVHERTRRPVESPVARVLREGTVVGLANHTMLIARDGSERPIDDSAAPIGGESGAIAGVVLVFRDVGERRRAEEARRRLAALVESSDDGIVGKDLEGIITGWNAAAGRIYGYSAEEAIGRPFSILVPPDRAEEVERCAGALRRGERIEHFETVRLRKDGSRIDVSVSYSPVRDDEGELIGTAVISRDITDRRRAEEALRRHERQLRLVTDHAPVLLVHCDAGQRYKFANRPYAARFGREAGELVGRTIAEVLGREAYEAVRPHVEAALAGRREEFEVEVPYEGLGPRRVHCVYEPERDAGGRVVGLLGALTDVTESRRIERALREVEARLAAVVDHSPAYVFAKDRGGRYLLANRALGRAFGLEPAEFLGRTDFDYLPAEVARRFARDDAAVFAAGEPRTYEESFAWGGRTLTALTVKFPLRDESGAVYAVCGIATDVTALKQVQAELRAAAERFQLALEAAELGDWGWDAGTDVVTFSARGAEIFGIPPGPHMTWAAMQGLLHPEDRERARLEVERAVEGGGHYDIEYRVRRLDGAEVWVAALGRARYGPDGRPLGMFGVVQDITARKRAEEALREEARINETFYRIGQILAAELDLERVVQVVTDETTGLMGAQFGAFFYNVRTEGGEAYTLYALSGVPREAFAGFPMPRNTAIFEPTFRGEGAVRLDDVTADPRFGRNAPYRGMPEGHLPVRSYLAVPVVSRSDEVLGGLFFGHPEPGRFGERHERLAVGIAAQAAVAIDNARLYQRVREDDRRKGEFLSILSHELRNPLAPIRNALALLHRADGDLEARAEGLAVMDRQVRHLVRLIDDLMDLSRVNRSKLELRREPVELGPLVRGAVETTRGLYELAGHDLAVEMPGEPVWLDADPARVSQVLANLLSNAAKYTEPGGRVALEARREGGELVVSVRDTGIGIPREMLPRVFEMFTQVDRSLERSQGGLGIGLTLVQRLVEMHGGTIEARSEGPGRGSEFVVRLPVVIEPPADPTTPRDGFRPARLETRRILVVDDNLDAARTLARLLKRDGHEVQTAHDGAEALGAAEAFRPEVVLLDIGLPRLNGYEVARRLRQEPWGREVSLIALTGWGQEEDRNRSREAGFDHHLVKPVEPGALRELLVAVGGRR